MTSSMELLTNPVWASLNAGHVPLPVAADQEFDDLIGLPVEAGQHALRRAARHVVLAAAPPETKATSFGRLPHCARGYAAPGRRFLVNRQILTEAQPGLFTLNEKRT